MTDNASRRALLIACLALFALGCCGAAIGPLLPQLAQQTGSGLAALGGIFTAIFFGGLLTQLLAGPVSDRFGQRPVLLAGLVVMAVGLGGLTTSRSLGAVLAWSLLLGLGQGAVDLGSNLLVAATFARRSAAPLNFLHLFFGLGSVLGPAAVSLSLTLWANGLPALWLAGLMALLLLPLTKGLRVPVAPDEKPAVGAPGSGASRLDVSSVYRSPLLWACAGLLSVYVGIEVGIGGWATAYLGETTGAALQTAALATSGYWLGLSGGRLIGTLLGTRLGPYTILALDLAGSCLAALGLLAGMGHAPLTVAATILMGLCFGSVYPTMIALVTSTFKAAPGKAASVVAAAGSLGGMLVPWLQGVLLTSRGPASMPWVAAACCAIMVGLYAGTKTLSNRHPAARSA